MITFILVEPENPDNVGAACRAMKNMGLSDLRVVHPPDGWREKAKTLAVNASDVLKKARSFSRLEDALAGCQMIAGTTRRSGAKRSRIFVSYAEGLKTLQEASQKKQKIAVLFGKESKGLDNASLRACSFLISIPSHESYPSLNLAQAVMVVASGLFFLTPESGDKIKKPLSANFVAQTEIMELLEGIDLALQALNYSPHLRERIHLTFYGLLKRQGLMRAEAQMLRGLCRQICEKQKK